MVTPKEIGKKFKEEREKQKLTLTDAANMSRIHQKEMKEIENGLYDRIGKLYIKSFIKKYTLFLEKNTTEMLELYEEVTSDMPSKEFSVSDKLNAKDNEPLIDINPKKFQYIFITILSVVLIALIAVFVAMLRSRVTGENTTAKTSQSFAHKKTVQTPVKENKNTGFFNIVKKNGNFSFTVKATGEVWLQIENDDKVVFAGTLEKGGSRSWNFTSPVNIWTGKAENLECYVNGKLLDLDLKGVVKNISVSARGIKLPDS